MKIVICILTNNTYPLRLASPQNRKITVRCTLYTKAMPHKSCIRKSKWGNALNMRLNRCSAPAYW